MRPLLPLTSLLAALALLAAPGTATLAAPYGYWSTNDAPDGFRIGVIFPDFSPNEFAGLSLMCTPGTSTVLISLDSPRPMKQGAAANVAIIADGQRATYRGTAERSEMDDQTRIAVTTTMGDPVLTALAGAKAIAFEVQKGASPLPVRGAKEAFAQFLARCKAGPAED